jgi:hypothetical protein
VLAVLINSSPASKKEIHNTPQTILLSAFHFCNPVVCVSIHLEDKCTFSTILIVQIESKSCSLFIRSRLNPLPVDSIKHTLTVDKLARKDIVEIHSV